MNFSQFIKDVLKQFGANIQLGLPATIQSFDKVKMRADVKFFLQTTQPDGTLVDYPIVPNIPVQFIFAGGFYIRPEYVNGDKVWVTFSTYDIQESLDEYDRPESESIFGMHNATVSGSIATNKFTAPGAFNNESGLVIGHKDGNSYLVFTGNSIKANFGGKIIQLDASGIQVEGNTKQYVTHAELNTALQNFITALMLHVHTSAAPSSPTSPPTSPITLDITAAKSTLVQSQ